VAWSVDIDGDDITSFCQMIRVSPKLSRAGSAFVRYPAHLFQIEVGVSEMHVYDNGTLKHSGPCWYSQADGDPDSAYAEVTSWGHMIHLRKRLCKTSTGNLVTPDTVITTQITGPAILSTYIQNTITKDGSLPLTVGSVASGGKDLSGVPTNFPMPIEQMRSLLVSTGQLNVLQSPGIGSTTLDFTNGDVVNDLTGSVAFEYGTGAYNAQLAQKTVDMDDVINALWYLLGPRKTVNRWAGSITPTAANAGGDGAGGFPATPWPADLVTRFMSSRSLFGYMQEIRVFDDKGDEQSIRPLFEEEWANEAWLRAYPQSFVSIRPERGSPVNFWVGDMVHVAAGSVLHGGFSGGHVIHGFDIEIDADGVVEVANIIATAKGDTA
jgi:hypothetical protein